jgi:hypothetical protein
MKYYSPEASATTLLRMQSYMIGLAAVQLLTIIFLLIQVHIVPFDIYHTTPRVFFDEGTNHTVVDSNDPILVHMTIDTNLAPTIIIASITITVYLLVSVGMLRGYEENGSSDFFISYFASNNEEIATSPAVLLWNSLFALVLASTHFVYLAMTITPCSIEYLAIATLVTTGPLFYIIMPRSAKQDGDHTKVVVLCGIPNHLCYLAIYSFSSLYILTNIPYDPTGNRFQILILVAALDILVLAVGHLWDYPPVVQTVFNCRTIYVFIASVFIILLIVWQSSIHTRYAPYTDTPISTHSHLLRFRESNFSTKLNLR